MSGVLTFQPKAAKISIGPEKSKRMSPFVQITIGGQVLKSMESMNGGMSPKWTGGVTANITVEQFAIVRIMDKNKDMADDTIGETKISIPELVQQKNGKLQLILVKKGYTTAKLTIDFDFKPMSPHHMASPGQPINNFIQQAHRARSVGQSSRGKSSRNINYPRPPNLGNTVHPVQPTSFDSFQSLSHSARFSNEGGAATLKSVGVTHVESFIIGENQHNQPRGSQKVNYYQNPQEIYQIQAQYGTGYPADGQTVHQGQRQQNPIYARGPQAEYIHNQQATYYPHEAQVLHAVPQENVKQQQQYLLAPQHFQDSYPMNQQLHNNLHQDNYPNQQATYHTYETDPSNEQNMTNQYQADFNQVQYTHQQQHPLNKSNTQPPVQHHQISPSHGQQVHQHESPSTQNGYANNNQAFHYPQYQQTNPYAHLYGVQQEVLAMAQNGHYKHDVNQHPVVREMPSLPALPHNRLQQNNYVYKGY